MRSVPESDWKKLRLMQSDVLACACKRIFEKIDKILSNQEGKEHEAYQKLWKLMNREDREISLMFDDLKRSNAIHKLATWKRNGLISDEVLTQFSDETQQKIALLGGAL